MRASLIPIGVLLLAAEARAADSHVIAVSVAPEQTCPAPRQIIDALAARLPGVVLPPGQPAKPRMMRLAISTDATGGIRLDLADPEGAPLLHRVLTVTRGPNECLALADTIALIIERYWREVGYDAPPLAPPSPPPPPPAPPPAAPPPPPAAPPPAPAAEITREAPKPRDAGAGRPPLRWWAAAAIAGRAGDTGTRDASALVALGVEGRIGFRLSAGVSSSTAVPLEQGEADFRRFPLRVGAYLPISVGVGQIEPGVGVNLDLISFGVRGDGGDTALGSPESCSARLCQAAGADLAFGWSYASSHHVFARAMGRVGVAAAYDFVTKAGNPPAIGDPNWRTPSTYLEVGVESGVWFP